MKKHLLHLGIPLALLLVSGRVFNQIHPYVSFLVVIAAAGYIIYYLSKQLK
jgi:hypothetical protein